MNALTPHILVVDDDPGLRDLYTCILAGAGYEVTLAANGLEALDLITQRRPDAMVLDLSMAKLDGFGVLTRLQEQRIRVRTLVVSARHASQDVEVAIELGASDYLAKPFDIDQLLARIGRLTRRAA